MSEKSEKSEKQKPDPAKCLYCTKEDPDQCDNQPDGPGSCPQLLRQAAHVDDAVTPGLVASGPIRDGSVRHLGEHDWGVELAPQKVSEAVARRSLLGAGPTHVSAFDEERTRHRERLWPSQPGPDRTDQRPGPPRGIELGTKDKSMIWDDCPECARKHLAAAYAALAGPADGGFAPDWEVLLARAVIAEGERRAGYAGNIDLAIGCLAMAELQPDVDPAVAAEIRGERLRQSASRDAGPLRLGRFPGRSAFAAAHLLEACREAPAVADRICLGRWFGDGGFFRCGVSAQEGAESAEDLDCVLRGLLKWIKETYEIGGAE